MKKGFTLIELLAVIIILAVIALIATPIVLNVVNNARDSARKSSIAGFADATKLAITEYQFKEQGSVPVVDKSFVDKITYQGDKVLCGQDGENPGVYYSTSYGIVLHGCKVGDNDTLYYFGSGKVYTDKNDETYKKIFDSVKGIIPEVETSLVKLLKKQYSDSNTVGLLKEGENYYYKGTNSEVANNFVWYEGHLWRVIQVNSDDKLTMITQQPITTIGPSSAVWTTQAQYESSYINTWLNNVFYNSISDKIKIQKSTFNVGIYTNISELTTNQYVGLLDESQYTKAGATDSFMDLKDYFWLGNRFNLDYSCNVNSSGILSNNTVPVLYGVRPVIKISDLTITGGNGTLTDPFRETKTSTNTSNVKVGEYISVPGSSTYCNTVTSGRCLFRVVSKDSDSIKVILNGLLPATSQFGSTTTFNASSTINTPLTAFANSINATYRYSGNKVFNIGMYGNGANYTTVSSATYSGNVGLPVMGEMFSGNDIDVSTIAKKFVNSATIENPSVSSNFWGMNSKLSNIIHIISHGGNSSNALSTEENGVRPVLFLNLGTNSDLTFTKGDGTAENPYWLGN